MKCALYVLGRFCGRAGSVLTEVVFDNRLWVAIKERNHENNESENTKALVRSLVDSDSIFIFNLNLVIWYSISGVISKLIVSFLAGFIDADFVDIYEKWQAIQRGFTNY